MRHARCVFTSKLPFLGQFVNHLCVGRTHESADPLQFLTQFLVCYRRFFAKQEPFRLSEAIGGVMTPPYEVLRHSPINGSLNIPPRERTGRWIRVTNTTRQSVPRLSADTVRPINESLNISPRERVGQSEMRNDTHPTVSPEIVSGHRPRI